MIPEWFFELRLPEFFCAFCIGLLGYLVGTFVPPFCRPFTWGDPSINYPYIGSTFPVYSLAIMSIIPCLIFAAVCFRDGNSAKARSECVAWVLSLCVGVALSMLIVDTIKVYAGRLRPDFLDRLRRAGINATTPITDYCAVSDKLVRGGRLSFPSGHTGISFAAMCPLVMFLVRVFQPFRHSSFPRFLLCIVPLVLSVIVGLSRTRDYVHNFDDIAVGAGIGLLSSYVAVLLHFRVDSDEFSTKAFVEENTAIIAAQSNSPGSNEVHLTTYLPPGSSTANGATLRENRSSRSL